MIRRRWFWMSLMCKLLGHVDPTPGPEFDDETFYCTRCRQRLRTDGMSWKEYYKTHERVTVCFGDDAWGRDPTVWLPKDRDKSLDKTLCV